MVAWYSLPPELREPILHFLIQGTEWDKSRNVPTSRIYSRCAVTCKDWHDAFERANFKSLCITARDLPAFALAVQGRRRTWLKHLWFRIELPTYPSYFKRRPETYREQQANNQLFTDSLYLLFKTLSNWKTGHGLELEISAHSPSDKTSLMGDLAFNQDGDSRFMDNYLDLEFDEAHMPDFPDHNPKLFTITRENFPEVQIVTTFSSLRRNYRHISAGSLTTLFAYLPNLQRVRYEPWTQTDPDILFEEDEDFANDLRLWPDSLKSVSIYEHDDLFECDDLINDEDAHDLWSRGLARAFATLSLALEEFAVYDMIDARRFFKSIPKLRPYEDKLPAWENLRLLSLTSLVMTFCQSEPQAVNDFLRLAGQAARLMPKLEIMELWYALRRGASVFRYRRIDETKSKAQWQSTWGFVLDNAVKAAWNQVAVRQTRQPLEVAPEEIITNYTGRMRFIQDNLQTGSFLLHEASFKDMRELGGRSLFLPSGGRVAGAAHNEVMSDSSRSWETVSEAEVEDPADAESDAPTTLAVVANSATPSLFQDSEDLANSNPITSPPSATLNSATNAMMNPLNFDLDTEMSDSGWDDDGDELDDSSDGESIQDLNIPDSY